MDEEASYLRMVREFMAKRCDDSSNEVMANESEEECSGEQRHEIVLGGSDSDQDNERVHILSSLLKKQRRS